MQWILCLTFKIILSISLHYIVHYVMLIVINNVTNETLKDTELVVKSVKYRITRAITLVDPIFFSQHCPL